MKLKIIIIGKVHEMGFRLFLLNLAEALLIPKFDVRNIYINEKQAVQVLIEGEEKQLKEFIKRLREEAPERAEIEKIEAKEYHEKIRTIEDYRNSLVVEQLNKIVQVGLTMIEKQGETIEELRGFRGEFKDYRKEFRNYRGEFKSFIDEFGDYRKEFREFAKRTDESFKIILEKYGEISEKLTTMLETLREDAKETRKILNTLREESRETRKILDTLRRDSKETREKLTKALELLEKAITKLLEK